MTTSLSDLLRSYHERFYGIFSRYRDDVEDLFLGDERTRARELHRGKHFLAHGIVEQFNAKHRLLLPALSDDGSDRLRRMLRRIHDRCVRSIRMVHDAVNEMTQPDTGEKTRRDRAHEILRHLHKIEVLLRVAFNMEEELVEDQAFEELTDEDLRSLEDRLERAARQDRGCSGHPGDGKS